MTMTTLTSKGQVTIPLQVRKALGLEAGDRIEFIEMETGQYAVIPVTKSVRSLKGILEKPAKPVSIEAMNAAISARFVSSRK